jgi:hypothetical protein
MLANGLGLVVDGFSEFVNVGSLVQRREGQSQDLNFDSGAYVCHS